jgi:hypothetical protein
MPKRTKLVFDRNSDDTQKYNVYRGNQTGVTSSSELVMEISQPAAQSVIKDVVGETLSADAEFLVYTAGHKNIINDGTNYPVTVYVNGTEQTTGFTINYLLGKVTFDVALTVNDVITMDYSYDAVEVLDDDGTQTNVTFLGTVAQDLAAPDIPANPGIVGDDANNKAIVSWDGVLADNGSQYFYKVEAEDEVGNKSTLTAEVAAVLTEGLHANPYVLEKSEDGGNTWSIVGEFSTTSYEETGVDTTAPDGVASLVSTVTEVGDPLKPAVQLTWQNPADDNETMSLTYRVKSQDANGNVSSPGAAVGPVPVSTGLKRVFIKRKVDDGTYPTNNDTSLVVFDSTDFTNQSFVDLDVAEDTIYNYSVFVEDNAANVSVAATVQASVGDFTAPETVTGLAAEEVTI